MFGPKFQRRYALTDQGVFNTKRGTFWTVIVNLIVMGGIGILYFLMTMAGKYMSVKALSSVFDPDKYSGDDIIYIKKVLNSMSIRTIWRGFYSTNNYCMPSGLIRTDTHIEYWYGEDEKSAREWDMKYVRNMFPGVVLRENQGQDHAEFFTLHPKEFCREMLHVLF